MKLCLWRLFKWKLTKLFVEKAMSAERDRNCLYRWLSQSKGGGDNSLYKILLVEGTTALAAGCYISREDKTVSREGCVI